MFLDIEGYRHAILNKYFININHIIEIKESLTDNEIFIYTMNNDCAINVKCTLKDIKIKIKQIL